MDWLELLKQEITQEIDDCEVLIVAGRAASRIIWREQDNHDGGSSYHLAKTAYYYPDGNRPMQIIGLHW